MNQAGDKFNILITTKQLRRSGLIAALAKESHYHLIEVSETSGIADHISKNQIDLLLIEDNLPTKTILDLVIKVRGINPEIQILVIADESTDCSLDEVWRMGIDDILCQPISEAMLIHRVARALMIRRLNHSQTALTSENRDLWKLAITDGLTKLINRRHFNERLIGEFARARRFGGSLGCVIVDIDFFKKVNDTYGHLVGDHVLQALAVLLSKSVRSIDVAARYGGEEFVLLLPETIDEGLLHVAERIRETVEQYDFRTCEGMEHQAPEKVTISLGVSKFPDPRVKTGEQLLELADAALYRAKQNGRNRVEVA